MLENLLQDLRHGLRLLIASPGFALVAVLSLALGIGANTAIFELLDAVRLRSLPVQHPEQLVNVKLSPFSASGRFFNRYSYNTNPQWELVRDQQQGFSGMFAWAPDSMNTARGGEVRVANVLWVSGETFDVLGVKPEVGRLINPSDDRRGCAGAAVVSDAYARREFGTPGAALQKAVTLDSHPLSIIGVTPPEFFGVEVGRTFDIAIPLCTDGVLHSKDDARLDQRIDWWLILMGRLKPGWTAQRATAQLQAISPAIFQATLPPQYHPDDAKGYLANKFGAFPAENGISDLRSDYSNPLWMLLAIAGLVLLIACANLANLMLARASAREKEIAVRLALGASRARLIRQLLSESLLLAFAGALSGVILAKVLGGVLVSMISTESDTMFLDLSTDYRVLGFTAALAVVTCILFGLAPALRATQSSPASVMRASGRGLTANRERFGLRRILVVTQVALSLVLLVGALLFAGSLRNLMTVDAGFKQDGILVTNLAYESLKIPKERTLDFRNDLLEKVRAIPGVESVANAAITPLSGSAWRQQIHIDGKKFQASDLTRVTPGYFATLGTPFLSGRDFDNHDVLGGVQVAIVNEAFAKKYYGGANPVGKIFGLEADQGKPNKLYQIVGMVKNTKYQDLREDFPPIGFFPDAQDTPGPNANLVIRSSLPLTALTSAVKRTVAGVSPDIDINFQPFRAQIMNGLLRERLMATLSGFFGALAGILAVVGLYGVISYMVARRTNEIGIRMALGASGGGIALLILREAALLLAIGLVAGAGLALAAGRTAASMLFGLKPYDPPTLLFAVVVLALVAVAASYIPARRAAGVDPMVALREE